ncbi:MAG: phosphoribosylamine--glycine ligase [Bacteroidota bacterium]|jgi:phosphoribosylamine--glycine ligase
MNILLLGSGGREHALAWKIQQSKHCQKLYIAPGNPGTAAIGENIAIDLNDFKAIADCCKQNDIHILVVGPEDPLVKGIYDYLRSDLSLKHLIIVGPSAEAAQLEGSKAYAKAFMERHGIPTAAYKEFTKENFEEGKAYIQQHSLPVVLKADGLAAGKGVVIANSHEEALTTFEEMILDAKFGEASARVVIEQFLKGVELSVFALTDGHAYVLLPEAKDYKRIGEGDAGLNTGGMGAVSPVPFAEGAFMQKVIEKVVKPTIAGLSSEKLVYNGFVFFGLINVDGEPFVIEYNCRMGDPETEVVMPRLTTDLVELFIAMGNHTLVAQKIAFHEKAAATVVLVSGGYPESFEKGKVISGLDAPVSENTIIFHAGVKQSGEQLLTNGGRVLAVTSYGNDISNAVETSVAAIQQIQYDQKYFRSDIGYEFRA